MMILVTTRLTCGLQWLRMVEVGEILKAREVKAKSSMGRDVTLGLSAALSAQVLGSTLTNLRRQVHGGNYEVIDSYRLYVSSI